MLTRIALALFIILCGPGAALAHAAGERPGGFFASQGEAFSPNLAWWAADPFTDPEGVLWIGVDGTGPDPISRIRLQISGQTTDQITDQMTGQMTFQSTRIATNRTYHPDRNAAAFWFALDSLPQTTREIQVVAVVEHENQAPALHSSPVTISRNQIGWDTRAFAAGWSLLSPAPDSRLLYVAADGNDSLAAAVHGRGYYLPSDPEIGPDPTNPIGPITAYASPEVAMRAMRLTNWLGTRDGQDLYGDACGYSQKRDALGHDWQGYPDWLLYRRGDDFRGFLQPDREEIRPRHHGLRQRGRSANQPMVITAWGKPEAQRPILDSWRVIGHAKHLRLVSLDFNGRMHWDSGAQSQTNNAWWAEDILVEDVRARGLGASNHAAWDGVLVRRSVVMDVWDADAHNQGLFIANLANVGEPLDQGPSGQFWPQDSWRIEETVFDRNGYKQDPNQPQTWTRAVNRIDDLPPGTGVQPRRTFYDHNIYASTYGLLHLRGNIFSRNGGGNSVQMRLGGVADRNLFLWNESALITSSDQSDRERLQDAAVRSNLVLHDDIFLPPGGFGQGLRIGVGAKQSGVLAGNIVAHFHRITNGGGLLGISGIPGRGDRDSTGYLAPCQSGYITAHKNLALSEQSILLHVRGPESSAGAASARIDGNILVSLDSGEAVRLSAGHPSPTLSIGSQAMGNHYFLGRNAHFSRGEGIRENFEAWRAAGFDARSTAFDSPESLAAVHGWPDQETPRGWERDIVSYMQHIDPFFVPDDNVFVDADAAGPKQVPRQTVREALVRFDQFPHDGGERPRMSEADAKRAARRYHAFLAFIHQARENRKHAWDHRYTAQALISYIRDGFNLPTLGARGETPSLPAPYLSLLLKGILHQAASSNQQRGFAK
jgi:hypothetical protein